jgi:hypothetical protein
VPQHNLPSETFSAKAVKMANISVQELENEIRDTEVKSCILD